ncbi:MAG: NYN domain-containing protein [Candidatus Latescibacteria bacterium]|nr:NYN domain-containing protein [Candidatus Latescibacterota bacterium]
MRTSVYIDGFNLYYGALRGTPYQWLDLNKMCCTILPKHQIHTIKYFTARVSARPNDPGQSARQQTYLRALRTLPNVEIIFGHFLTHEVYMPLAGCPPQNQQYVKVIRTEEKGSDVNLAAHLLNDGYKGEYEVAVVITNDSDLQAPIRIVRQELQLPVGILNPYRQASRELVRHASFVKTIRKGLLAASQFPPTLQDSTGLFSKPSTW